MSDRTTHLTKKIPGAFKHLKDCLKLANCRHLLLYGKYAKNKKTKDLNYNTYTVNSHYLNKSFGLFSMKSHTICSNILNFLLS